MNYKVLQEKHHIDSETGFLCRYVRSNTERFIPHSHNYYEIFIIIKGTAYHIVNSKKHILKEGHLLFIRDYDIHDYLSINGEYFEFINLAISKKLLFSALEYLGNDFKINELLDPPFPPIVALSQKEKEKLFFLLTDIDPIKNKSASTLKVKTLIIDLLTKYFINFQNESSNIPEWLEIVYEKMKKPSNFIEGAQKMVELSGKTREHLTRSLKKHYNTTPIRLVNDLRLDYCANLLVKSNLPIIDISMSCGFDNLSWFYKVFQEKYNMTPLEYRKEFEVIKNPTIEH